MPGLIALYRVNRCHDSCMTYMHAFIAPQVAESLLKHTINGRLFCNLEGLTMAVGERYAVQPIACFAGKCPIKSAASCWNGVLEGRCVCFWEKGQ